MKVAYNESPTTVDGDDYLYVYQLLQVNYIYSRDLYEKGLKVVTY